MIIDHTEMVNLRNLLVTLHYWNFRVRRVPDFLPRANSRTLGKITDAESSSREKAHFGKHSTLERKFMLEKNLLGMIDLRIKI